MGLPKGAVQQALQKEGKDPNILDMDPEKSYASQVKKDGAEKDVGPPLKDDQNAVDEKDAGRPLKDDPEFSKFFKVCIDLPGVYILFLCCYSHINVLLRSLLLYLSDAQGKSFAFVAHTQNISSLLILLYRAIEL